MEAGWTDASGTDTSGTEAVGMETSGMAGIGPTKDGDGGTITPCWPEAGAALATAGIGPTNSAAGGASIILLMTGLPIAGSALANSGIGPTNVADGGAATCCGVLTTAGIGPTKSGASGRMTTGTAPASGAIWGAGGMAGSIAAPDASPGFAAVTASAGGSSSRRRISMALVSISVAVIGLGSLVSPGCMPAKTGSVVGSTTGSVAELVAAASSDSEGGVRSDPAATSSFVSLVASSSTSMSLMSGAGPMP